jgi:hypothetical protein
LILLIAKSIADNNEKVVNFILWSAMRVSENSYYTISDLSNMGFLFPFEYKVKKEQLMVNEHFVINNFGREIAVALK